MEEAEGLWSWMAIIEDSPDGRARELSTEALHNVQIDPEEILRLQDAFVVGGEIPPQRNKVAENEEMPAGIASARFAARAVPVPH